MLPAGRSTQPNDPATAKLPAGAAARALLASEKLRPVRFLVVGGWNTLFGWLAYVGFFAVTSHFGWSYLWATIPAQFVGILNAYVFQRWVVFGAQTSTVTGSFLRFSLVYWALWAVNTPALALIVWLTHWDPRLAIGLLTIVNAVVSYFVHHRFTFRVAKAKS